MRYSILKISILCSSIAISSLFCAPSVCAQVLDRKLEGVPVSKEAIDSFNKTVELCKQSKFSEAEPICLELVTKFPKVSLFTWQLGRVYMENGKLDKALSELSTTTKQNPKRPDPYLHIGAVQFRLGNYPPALAALKTYLRLKPDSPLKAKVQAEIKAISDQVAQMKSVKANSPEGTYLGLMTISGVRRWRKSRMPLKVFINDGTMVDGYKPEYLDVLKSGFDSWQTRSDKTVEFTFVDKAEQADIECYFSNDLTRVPSIIEGGHTVFTDSENGRESAEIVLLTNGPDKVHPKEFLEAVALHEIGHAIGLSGHSDKPDDIMFTAVSADHAKISDRDLATLKALYTLPPKAVGLKMLKSNNYSISTSNKGKAAQVCQKGVDQLKREKNYRAAITSFREAIKLDPRLKVAFQNLSIALNVQACESFQAGNQKESDAMFKESIQLQEKYGFNKDLLYKFLHNYKIALESQGRKEEALVIKEKMDSNKAK